MQHRGVKNGHPVCSNCGEATSYMMSNETKAALQTGFYLVAFCDACEAELGCVDGGVMSMIDGKQGPLIDFTYVTSLRGGPLQ